MSAVPPEPKSVNPFRPLWRALTRPPFKAVPWAVLLYVLILRCLVYVDNGPLTGHIVGFDAQVRHDAGAAIGKWRAGWSDRLITRVNAPKGFRRSGRGSSISPSPP